MSVKKILALILISYSSFGYTQSQSGYFPEKKTGTIAYRTLNIKGVPQSQSQWCWAAVSAAVINHYNYYKTSDCKIASEAFKINCCSNPAVCNNQNSIFFIQKIIDEYSASSKVLNGTITASNIKKELDNDNPLILRIESKYGGHFIVIGGYSINRDKYGNEELSLMIQDPMWGYQMQTDMIGKFISYKEMKNGSWDNYSFKWTHTMLFDEYE
jgi:hypothetical protein